jgi:hypothetical protein
MTKATDRQVDGDHYSKLQIQPMELAYSINASPCFSNVCKYITRDKDSVFVQLNKAMHCIELEEELMSGEALYGDQLGRGGAAVPVLYYEKISAFSAQFEHSNLISAVLLYIHDRQYDMAKFELNLLKFEALKDDK